MIRDMIQLLEPTLTGLGILLSIWGTYLLTRWYHPFDASGFFQTVIRVVLLVFKGNVATVFREAGIASKLAAINEEAKSDSLVGLYFIFLGFVLQGAGALCWTIDAVWGVVQKHAA